MKVLIAGDLCPKNRVADLFNNEHYEEVLGQIKQIIQNSDYSIVNLEAPIVESEANPIEKCGPNLKCSSSVVSALKYAGFNCVTLANNHFYDYGEVGALTTFDELRNNEIDFVGAGLNKKDASRVLYKRIKDKQLAIVNYCEYEYSIAGVDHAGSNHQDTIDLFYTIREARKKSDYLIAIIHGGIEHFQYPTNRMIKTYRYLIDLGVDAVINHHQHCFSGYETYKQKPIFYGLGNFCFDSLDIRNSLWNEGYFVALNFEGDRIIYEIIPYTQCDQNANIELKTGDDRDNFFLRLNDICKTIQNERSLAEKINRFMDNTQKELDPIHPWHNRYLRSLYKRGLLPSFVPRSFLMLIQSCIKCESHLERLIYSIDKRLLK